MDHTEWLGPCFGFVLWPVVLFVSLLIAGLLLRAACALVNRMAGGSGPSADVPVPATGKAMAIVLGVSLVQFVVNFLFEFRRGPAARAAGVRGFMPGFGLQEMAIPFLVGLFIMSSMLSGLLPTGFWRATLVTLLYHVFLTLVAAALLFLALVIWFGLLGR